MLEVVYCCLALLPLWLAVAIFDTGLLVLPLRATAADCVRLPMGRRSAKSGSWFVGLSIMTGLISRGVEVLREFTAKVWARRRGLHGV